MPYPKPPKRPKLKQEMPYWDAYNQQWCAEHVSYVGGTDEVRRDTEWFDKVDDALRFRKYGVK